MKKLVIASLAAILVSGCATTGEQNGTWGGAAVGGALGAIIGDAVDCKGCALIGGVAGALLGGSVGRNIGRRMDAVDARRTAHAIDRVPDGRTSTWQNPNTNYQYTVTPTKTYINQGTGDYCREVTIGQARVGEERQKVYGTACRQPDGSWKMQ